MNDKELDKLFSEQLKNEEASPNPAIWENIEAALDKSQQKPVIRKLQWLKYAAMLSLAFGLALYWYAKPKTAFVPAETLVQYRPEKPQVLTPAEPKETLQEDLIVSTPEQMPYVAKAKEPLLQVKGTSTSNPPAVARTPEESSVKSKKLVLPNLSLASVNIDDKARLANDKIIMRKVVEVEPIAPLLTFPEEEETMLASNQGVAPSQNIVSGILNKITNAITTDEQKVLRFSHDEEGSFHIDINNSFAKNRFKRKK